MQKELDSTADPVWSRLFPDTDHFERWYQTQSVNALDTVNTEVTYHLLPPDTASRAYRETLDRICNEVKRHGFACYEWSSTTASEPRSVSLAVGRLLQSMGLSDSDKGVIRDAAELSLLQDLAGTPQGRFPAYKSSAMNWHTDGYYNDHDDTIRSFTLHCIHPAANGGELILMDHNLLILALINEAPETIRLLSHPAAMTLPENRDDHGHDRPDRTVPVVFSHPDQSLGMRFTTRSQNIQWRCTDTRLAAEKAQTLIIQHQQWHTMVKLGAGQGIITRNVLHARNAFSDPADQPKRQMLRGRFKQIPIYNNPTIDPTTKPTTR